MKAEKIVDELYWLELQNLNGREDFEKAFRKGIEVGIEHAKHLLEEEIPTAHYVGAKLAAKEMRELVETGKKSNKSAIQDAKEYLTQRIKELGL